MKIHLNFIIVLMGSLLIHAAALIGMALINSRSTTTKVEPVKIKVVENKKPEPSAATSVPPKPKESIPNKKPEQRKERSAPTPNAARVQGITKESVSETGSVAAPLGNSLMIEDKGKRLTPEEIATLKRDLSSPPLLIVTTYAKPPYTDAALAANVEGRYVVEVFVDETGAVSVAEMKKPIGFGMDERIIAATKGARFQPAKNEKGVPYAAWGEFVITLELE